MNRDDRILDMSILLALFIAIAVFASFQLFAH